MKYGFVYLWFDKKHKKYYIGSHWGTENDGYICSSNNMRDNYRNRKEDFSKRKIIKRIFTNRKSLLEAEQYYLDLISKEEFGIKYYNISSSVKGPHWWMNEETRKIIGKKIGNSCKGRIPSNKGKSHTKEAKQKMSLANKGRPAWNKGKINIYSETTRKKMGWSKGKKVGPCSEEKKRKIKQTMIGMVRGPMSNEHKNKIRESMLRI